MKITFILPVANLSGGIKVVGIYARELAKRGHEVVLMSTPLPDMRLRSKVKSLLTGRGWPSSKQPESHLDGLGLDHRVLERWRPVTDADVPDADVAIATWWETAEWVSALSGSKGAIVYFIQYQKDTAIHKVTCTLAVASLFYCNSNKHQSVFRTFQQK